MPRIGRAFRVEDPNAAAILEMQGGQIRYPRMAGQRPIAILPEELAMDEFFMEHTFPYINPGPEVINNIPSKRDIRSAVLYDRQADAIETYGPDSRFIPEPGLVVDPVEFRRIGPVHAMNHGFAPAVPVSYLKDGAYERTPLASRIETLDEQFLMPAYHDAYSEYVEAAQVPRPSIVNPYVGGTEMAMQLGYAPAMPVNYVSRPTPMGSPLARPIREYIEPDPYGVAF